MIDLRSDTVTRPTPSMRQAIAAAEVGDDQYGEDPSVNRLQEQVTVLLGKEAALFVPTGTLANQLALRLFCRPGDDVIVGVESHLVWHEAGGGAANSGVQFTTVGSDGRFTADELRAAVKVPGPAVLHPPTTLVAVENTQNRMGGRVWPSAQLQEVGAAARELGIASMLDGARLLNAAVACGESPAALAAPFDLVWIALSKGLGCPGGSVLAGRAEDMAALVRHRRMLGGAMRQAGFFAAAGSYALEHHVDRLAEDHRNATTIAAAVAHSEQVQLLPQETNIVVFRLGEGAPDAAAVVSRASEHGVLVSAFGPRTVRATTHLDVSAADCERAAEVLGAAVATL
jgi:threonine aldolase